MFTVWCAVRNISFPHCLLFFCLDVLINWNGGNTIELYGRYLLRNTDLKPRSLTYMFENTCHNYITFFFWHCELYSWDIMDRETCLDSVWFLLVHCFRGAEKCFQITVTKVGNKFTAIYGIRNLLKFQNSPPLKCILNRLTT